MKPIIYLAICLFLIGSVMGVADLYNMTALDNSNNIYEYAIALNTISDYAIGFGILLIVFSIAFMVNMGNTGSVFGGLAAGSFITGLTATILLPLGFITWDMYQYIIVIAIMSFGVSFWFARG